MPGQGEDYDASRESRPYYMYDYNKYCAQGLRYDPCDESGPESGQADSDDSSHKLGLVYDHGDNQEHDQEPEYEPPDLVRNLALCLAR